MEKINIKDLIEGNDSGKSPNTEDRQLTSLKKKKLATLFDRLKERFRSFIKPLSSVRLPVNLKELVSKIKNLNIYRKLRESLVRFYLKRTIATIPVDKEKLLICWQPVPLILAKVAIVAAFSYWFYSLHPVVGKWLKTGFDFFKLQDIYNFEFPRQDFFDSIAMYIFLFIIAYHGLYFLYHQLIAFLSVLVVNEAEDKVYIVQNVFIRKTLHVFSIPDIALVILRQNILSRLLGIGTISLEKKSGDLVEIRSIAGARQAVKLLSRVSGK